MLDSLNEGLYVSIDADSLIYGSAYRFKDSDDTDAAIKNLDDYVRTLLDNTSATYYAGFLGGEKCFRYDIAVTKPYKGNRPPSPDWYKKWSGPMKAHLRDEWNFQIVNGIEADDAVCIYQTWCRENNKNSIMCHGDKDLYQIEGNHYDIRKHSRKYVSEVDGWQNLYKQLLTGDASDNITGLAGCGKVKASKTVDHLTDFMEMSNACKELFKAKHGESYLDIYSENYNLVWLLTHSDTLQVKWEQYTPKNITQEPEIDLTGILWD